MYLGGGGEGGWGGRGGVRELTELCTENADEDYCGK